MQVRLEDPVDLEAFRGHARRLLADGVPPDHVEWLEGAAAEGAGGLFDASGEGSTDARPPLHVAARQPVPASFVALCADVILHRDPQRFTLLYRLLWRLVHEPGLRHAPIDADMMQAQLMAKAVHRDIHKMRAFVRFTRVEDGEGGERHVAWFEPDHHIVEANAPFFARRFAQMRWAILTPERCIEWDGQALSLREGADRREKPPPDAGEQLWLTYYENIFNPARLKLAMMRREMPRRYWHNLPEAALIQPLAEAAAQRSQSMIDAPATPARRIRAPIQLHPVPADGMAPADLDQLRAAAHACRACPIGALATQAVCGEGPAGRSTCWSASSPATRKTWRAGPSSGRPGNCSTARWRSWAGRARACTWPMPSSTSSTNCAASGASTRRPASARPWPARTGSTARSRWCARRRWWRSAPRPHVPARPPGGRADRARRLAA